ncbi:MAG: CRTAC1 family protein [Gemmatimonadales bacterium]|nr:CRTAC1 family protein [Gemmatimonadales bacterium]MYG49678.1 CRTAC1 family protein [Gemmatimonadales bacterium]MYK02233.1 CRTAC1 family protein [Candidatus Palauibacter ramosifaciens]
MSAAARLAAALLAVALPIGCGEPSADPPGRGLSEGTLEMAARLLALADSADPLLDEQLNTARLRYLTELPPSPDAAEMLARVANAARELLNAGHTQPALEQLIFVDQTLERTPAEPFPGFRRSIEELIGTAFLRLGAEVACPAAGPAAGTVEPTLERSPCWPAVPPAASRPTPVSDSARAALNAAVGWHRSLLQLRPDDLRARWVLNLAAMTAGTWPDSVPPEYRIEAAAMGGAGEFPRFEDVATGAGLDAISLSGGAIVDDLNGDGLPDVMTSSRGLLHPLRYFESDGQGRFVDRTARAGLEGLLGGLNLVHADYDNDGDADVFVLRGGWLVQPLPNSLLRNDGGAFADVTREAGLYSEHPTQTGSWADFDGDGWLDLFIGNESRDSLSHRSELYRNRGDGTFEEVGAAVGLGVTDFVKGVAWGDVDNDGRPDLYLSILHASNRLYRNLGPTEDGGWAFEDVTAEAGVGEPAASFPTWFWDFDNDGWLDIYVAGYAAQTADLVREMTGEPHSAALPRLYRNLGRGAFADVTAAQGLDRIMYAMGSNYGDLDGDGRLDFLIGTGDPDLRQLMPNRMFRNLGDRFEEITGAGGFGSLHKGHAVSFVDIDNDGDTDVHIQLGGAMEGDLSPNALYENPGFDHRWIALTLVGERANRPGIGARITVTVEGPEGTREIHRRAGTGGSFGSNPLRQEIGLGRATRIESVEIRWPGSGTVDRITGLALDRAYRIGEGTGIGEPLERPRIRLGGP